MRKFLIVLLGLVVVVSMAMFVACIPREDSGSESEVYTVTIDGVEQKVVAGECAAEPILQKEGFVFVGWLCAGADYDFAQPVTSDLTITSVWSQVDSNDEGNFEVEITAFADSEARSIWKAQYLVDGIRFDIQVTDPNVKTENSDMGWNDNVELVLQTISTLRYDIRYTFNFLIDADGNYWFRRAKDTGSFGTSCAYDLFVEEGENLICSAEKTETGYNASVFFSYELLNSDYRSALGNIRFCPAMRNTDTKNTVFKICSVNGCTWGRPNTFVMIDKNNSMVKATYTPTDVNVAFENSTLYQGEKLTDNLAMISGGDGGSLVSEFKVGCNLFTDRYYGLNENAVCDDLLGKSYLYDSIEGSYGVVQKAGYVILLVPGYNYNDLEYNIKSDGFVKIISDESNIANLAVGSVLVETVNYYVKWCEVGELINYDKYCIVLFDKVNAPHSDDFLTQSAEFLTDFTGYELLSRHWQGVTTIDRSNGGRIFASWVSGGNGEPRGANYNVVVYSDDEGQTWHDLWIITHPSPQVKINDAQLWLDPDGVLWVFYVQSYFTESQNSVTGGAYFDHYSGVWAVKVEDPDADEIVHTAPVRLFDGLLRNSPVVLSDGTYLAVPNNYINELYTTVYASTDKGNTWSVRGSAYIPQATNFDEAIVFEQQDGSLRLMVRNEGGTILQVFSYDQGYSWSDVSDSGLLNPCSRFQMVRLPSGNVMLIYNENASARDDLMVCLSFDDGKTWNYKMKLDTRSALTYPDYAIDEQTGKIYVIWDQGRTVTGNICMAIFTEKDIMNKDEYGQDNIITISACPYVNSGLAEGENLGSLDNKQATGGFDLTNDSGENACALQLGEGVQKVWVKDFKADSVYFEADVKVWSILNRDGYPKAGLVLSGDEKDIFFYIDGSNWLQNYTVGVVTGTNDVWDWTNKTTVPASINYSKDFVRLAILKDGGKFRFFVNDYCVMEKNIDGLSEKEVVAGFMTFNCRVELKNYSASENVDTITKMSAFNKVADTLFMGDSYMSLYRWNSFFDEIGGTNVSVDGAKVQYWIDNFNKIVMPYNPEKIVINVGMYDIHSGTKATELYNQYLKLFELIESKLPNSEIIFVSVNPTVAYSDLFDEVKQINQMISDYCEQNDSMTFVDFAETLFNADKSYVNSQLYADRVLLNSQGYNLWNQMILDVLNSTDEVIQ